MKRLKARTEAEIIVKKSRFIAIAIPITGLDGVKAAVKSIWDEHPAATHVVHAAVAGPAGSLYSCSDDREPKNTAGRPALEVLKGSGITDIIVCIVRYFGGTLLGTGGLVKAYGDAVKEVLKVVQTEEIIARSPFSISLDYEYYDRMKRIMASYDIAEITEDFATAITIKGQIAESGKDAFTADFNALTQGRCTLRFL